MGLPYGLSGASIERGNRRDFRRRQSWDRRNRRPSELHAFGMEKTLTHPLSSHTNNEKRNGWLVDI